MVRLRRLYALFLHLEMIDACFAAIRTSGVPAGSGGLFSHPPKVCVHGTPVSVPVQPPHSSKSTLTIFVTSCSAPLTGPEKYLAYDTSGTARCICDKRWTGSVCNVPRCLNGATLTDELTCECPDGWTGTHCEYGVNNSSVL